MKYINKSFLKMLIGFLVILVFGVSTLIAFNYLSGRDSLPWNECQAGSDC